MEVVNGSAAPVVIGVRPSHVQVHQSFSMHNLPYTHLVALIQSENHASNKGKMAGRCQNDIHLMGIGLIYDYLIRYSDNEKNESQIFWIFLHKKLV